MGLDVICEWRSNQTGYSRRTTMNPTLDNGLSFIASSANPFPGGWERATGTTAGLMTNVGQGISFFNPNLRTPYMQRWQAGVQREPEEVDVGPHADADYNQITIWNLRGVNVPFDTFVKELIRRAKGYDLIILDPLYKLLAGADENAAGELFEEHAADDAPGLATAANIAKIRHIAFQILGIEIPKR